jgi:hypothetical protein
MFWVAIVKDGAGSYARYFRNQLPADADLELDVLGACESREEALEVVDALQAGLAAQGQRRDQ